MSSAREHEIKVIAAVALGVLAVVVAAVLGWPRGGPRRAPGVEAPVDAAAPAAWCPAPYEPIPDDGCLALPAAKPVKKGLIVYLHGRHPPEQVPDEDERRARVGKLGTARGYAVLALRGRQGECLDPRLAAWWCWPSSERNTGDGPAYASRIDAAVAQAEERAGKGRRLLLGFSNGAYFAAMIARSALSPFDAIAIAHGGPVEPMHPTGKAPPLLLIDADDDPSGPEMDRLEADLSKEQWPHAMVAREGGHQLPEWDIEMALTFFDRTAVERLPFSPPLSSRARRLHPLDAGTGEPAVEPSATSTAEPTAPAEPSASASASAEPTTTADPTPAPTEAPASE